MALNDELCDWLCAQPLWQQDLARRLTMRTELDVNEVIEVLALMRQAYGAPQVAEAVPPEPRPFERHCLAEGATESPPKLLSFGELEGVGLIAGHGELAFAPEGLTLIYGQNAAGKSSYVRGLKSLCRTVDQANPIRGSVYSDVEVPPTGKVTTEVAGESMSRRTPLTGPSAARLDGLTVFDSACAELYVDSQNTVQYVPSALLLLTRLATAQDKLRKKVDSERAAIRGHPPATDGFPAGTRALEAIDSLQGADTAPDLAAIAGLQKAEAARLSTLSVTVAAADASTASADARAAQADAGNARSTVEALRDLTRRVGPETARRLREASDANRTAQQALDLANQQFSAAPISGIGGSAWQSLWDAARAFVEAGGGVFPPQTDEACPLCLQHVTTDAADHLARFEDHVKSAATASNEYSQRIASCPVRV